MDQFKKKFKYLREYFDGSIPYLDDGSRIKYFDKERLENLDMSKIVDIYKNKNEYNKQNPGELFSKTGDFPFTIVYPVIEEFKYISPHHWKYDKKYVKESLV